MTRVESLELSIRVFFLLIKFRGLTANAAGPFKKGASRRKKGASRQKIIRKIMENHQKHHLKIFKNQFKKKHPEIIRKSWENHPDENPENSFFGDPTYRVTLKTKKNKVVKMIFLIWCRPENEVK